MIKDLANSELSAKQLASLELLESWVASPIPLHAETPLLKQLKEINFETNAKYILLNAAYSQGDAQSKEVPYFGKLDENKIKEYLVVLNLDRLNRMQKLAQNSNEQDLKEVIAGVSAAFPTFIAQIYNNNTIEENIQNPANPAQQEAAKIIQGYNQKLIETIKRYSPAK